MNAVAIVVYVLAWGGVVHELVHCAAARPYADTHITWSVPAVATLDWQPGTPGWAVMLAHWAPFLVGYPLLAASALTAYTGLLALPGPWPVWLWVAVNLVLLAYPTQSDRILPPPN